MGTKERLIFMRKIFFGILMLVFLTGVSSASPRADEYRNKDYNIANLKTVLVLPVDCEAQLPDSEAFFQEKLSQKWKDILSPSKSSFTFLTKTPADILERDNFIKDVKEPEKLSQGAVVNKAIMLADQYVDAVLTAVVTKCCYINIRHPEVVTWETRYETKSIWINGRYEQISVPYQYRRVKPEWIEQIASSAVKLELKDSKTKELIYGISVTADTGDDLFTRAPSLTTQACNVLENAAKRMMKMK